MNFFRQSKILFPLVTCQRVPLGCSVCILGGRRKMKLVIFAHTPPPHHGQSYMVQLMLEGFGGDHRKMRAKSFAASGAQYGITCYHVNARVSRDLEEIGEFHLKKIIFLLGHCLSAIWCRFRYGVKTLYYIPAPGKSSALYRDWMVMLLCRPFYPKIILHWHAAGLAKWLETTASNQFRSLTYRFMKKADLSVVISDYNRGDAERFFAKKIALVPNAIPDPIPDFETRLLPRRVARSYARKKVLSGKSLTSDEREKAGGDPEIFHVFFLAHCAREKGLFDAMDGVALANAQLMKSNSPIRLRLGVGGVFVTKEERTEFDDRLRRPEFQSDEVMQNVFKAKSGAANRSFVDYHGFVSGADKFRLYAECDCFCFPTYYSAESFGLVLIEAMAFGTHIVTSNWRALPEVMPKNHPGLVPPKNPAAVASALLAVITTDCDTSLRQHFLENFTIERHLQSLSVAIHSIE